MKGWKCACFPFPSLEGLGPIRARQDKAVVAERRVGPCHHLAEVTPKQTLAGNGDIIGESVKALVMGACPESQGLSYESVRRPAFTALTRTSAMAIAACLMPKDTVGVSCHPSSSDCLALYRLVASN